MKLKHKQNKNCQMYSIPCIQLTYIFLYKICMTDYVSFRKTNNKEYVYMLRWGFLISYTLSFRLSENISLLTIKVQNNISSMLRHIKGNKEQIIGSTTIHISMLVNLDMSIGSDSPYTIYI